MHKCLKVAVWGLAGFVLLGVGGLFVGSLAIDSAVDKALDRISAKVTGLKLNNKFTSTSPFSREGILMWSYNPKQQLLGKDYLEGALKYSVRLGLFTVSGEFANQEGYGNFDSLFKQWGGPPLNYHGTFEASLLKMGLQAQLQTEPLSMPVPDGICSLGEQRLSLSTTTFRNFKTALDGGEVSCSSPLLYHGRPAYELKLSGLKVRANPRMVNQKPQLEEVQILVDDLQGSASSLYLIGFAPEDQVRDPSMREGFKFSKLDFKLSLNDQDRLHRSRLDFAGSGDLNFGLPLIKEQQTQPWFDLTDTRLSFTLEKLDWISLPKLASAPKESLPKLLGALLSDPVVLKLENFSFRHQGESMQSNGRGQFSLDPKELKPRNLELDFNFSLGGKLVSALFEQQYQEALEEAIKTGAVRFDGRNYQTRFVLRNNQMSLNGQPLSGAQ